MATVRPRYVLFLFQDSPESGWLILRDGTTASIRIARSEDKEAMARFFASLSPESKLHRFFSVSQPSDRSIDSFCNNANPQAKLTLVVYRLVNEHGQIVAAGSYIAHDPTTAEIALAVDDRLQGKGIGTLLLERLALLADERLSAVLGRDHGCSSSPLRDLCSSFDLKKRSNPLQ